MRIELAYQLRHYFAPFHQRDQRFAALIAHRRAGKTVCAVNDLIEKASRNTRKNPRYGYVAPLYTQAKQIAWQYLKEYAAPFNPKISESGLFVELPHNGARITLYGADNPDSFRGLYFDGLVLDEYGNMRPSIWTEVLLPTLVDRRGWAVFMGTPNGPNHFRDLYELRKNDPKWYISLLPVTATKAIPEDDLAEIREQMTKEEYAQEMLCDFSASTRGAYFAEEIALATSQGRIRDSLTFDRSPLNFSFDLGFRDDTSVWAWQNRPDGYAMQFTFADNNREIAHYVNVMNSICTTHNVERGQTWFPHDVRAKTLQTGRSMVEQLVDLGVDPEIVPSLSLNDGISAARLIFKDVYFHQERCESGLRALQSYRREYDEDKKVFRDKPIHDWASHYADSFRYFALVSEKKRPKASKTNAENRDEERKIVARGANYAFSLDELWANKRPRSYW